MSGRIATMRQALYDNLKKGSNDNWDHIIKQIGMFAYTVNKIYEILGI